MHYLRYKETPILLDAHKLYPAFRGEVRYEVLDAASGKLKFASPWSSNILTDAGLLNYGRSTSPYYRAGIGSSNTAPTAGDLDLGAPIGVRLNPVNTESLVFSTYPGLKSENVFKTRFDQTYVGTIREYGVWSYLYDNDISYRCLITPEYAKTDQEIVDVYHRVTMEHDKLWADYTSVTPITIGSDSFDYVVRPARLEYMNHPQTPMYAYGQVNVFSGKAVAPTLADHLPARQGEDYANELGYFYSGTQQSTSETRDDTVLGGDGIAYRDMHAEWHLNNANNSEGLPNGVRGAHWYLSATYAFRPVACVVFGRTTDGLAIQKDPYHVLQLSFRNRWSRI